MITIIDDDSPEFTDLGISSKPIPGNRGPNGWIPQPNDRDTYRSGESIDMTVTFDSTVAVDRDGSRIALGRPGSGFGGDGGIHDSAGTAARLVPAAVARQA